MQMIDLILHDKEHIDEPIMIMTNIASIMTSVSCIITRTNWHRTNINDIFLCSVITLHNSSMIVTIDRDLFLQAHSWPSG